MTFTEEQLKALSPWEENFRTAVNAQWARNPGTQGLKVIWQIFTETTGDTRRFNDNCNHCILSLLQDCGRLYFHDTIELATKKANAKAVVEFPGDKETVKKVPIKTTKKATKKPKA